MHFFILFDFNCKKKLIEIFNYKNNVKAKSSMLALRNSALMVLTISPVRPARLLGGL